MRQPALPLNVITKETSAVSAAQHDLELTKSRRLDSSVLPYYHGLDANKPPSAGMLEGLEGGGGFRK